MAQHPLDIGWLGLGRMGGAFASRLHDAGHRLTVWNRTESKAQRFQDAGVKVAASIAELATNEVVFTSVMADTDLVEVICGPKGLLSGPEQQLPRLVIDCSTVSTTASSQVREFLAARGVDFLAAPVSGNHEAVLAGRASFAVSGPRTVFDASADLFQVLGKGASYIDAGEGSRLVKLSHNLFVAAVFQALIEAMVLAEKGGVSRTAFLEFINNSAIGSMFTKYKAPTLANLDYEPRFTTAGLLKDIDLGLGEAKLLGVPMALIGLMRPLLQSAINHGWAHDDFNRLLDLQALGSALELTGENAVIDNGLGTDA
jgi:3-hydroxyisobutyrate dehydrogenase